MEPLQIAELIKDIFPDDVLEISDFRNQVSLTVTREKAKEILKYLHDDDRLCFDYLVDLCGVDYLDKKEPRFEVVYNLFSVKMRHFIRIKVQLKEDTPDEPDNLSLESVIDLWRGADWHERECYDMFGIRFNGHPDLRRVLMPEDWEGFPLRKDYPLKSDLGDMEWKEYKDLIEYSEKAKKYEVR
ncbi:MAG: NADH-quinone oxidoreductase subunit C [Thermodesulfovibrionales bacterium]|nr:NADH-quinone oxidoreductase subunit C [Thermodesulfovibrionales bacterium]